MDVYRSSLPLPGIFRPFHLFPSAHALPKPDPKESLSMESYIDSSDSEFGRAEARGSAGEEDSRKRSPSLSDGARADHPKGLHSAAWKRRASSQPGKTR